MMTAHLLFVYRGSVFTFMKSFVRCENVMVTTMAQSFCESCHEVPTPSQSSPPSTSPCLTSATVLFFPLSYAAFLKEH